MMGIDKRWIQCYKDRYDENNEKERDLEESIRELLYEQGRPPKYFNRDTLVRICRWKSTRIKGYALQNEKDFVEEVSKVALTTHNERLKLEVLTLLQGVHIRTATAILHFCFPDKYPIMDWRTWKSLKDLDMIEGELKDTYECWEKYKKTCRSISEENRVTIRDLDKSLWFFQEED